MEKIRIDDSNVWALAPSGAAGVRECFLEGHKVAVGPSMGYSGWINDRRSEGYIVEQVGGYFCARQPAAEEARERERWNNGEVQMMREETARVGSLIYHATTDYPVERNLVITHGDTDGIITGALIMEKYNLNPLRTDVLFVQPFTIDKVNHPEMYKEVYVGDMAINNRNPDMTKKFIETVGEKLKVWYDHHQGWENCGFSDERFIIDKSSPSCAALVGGPDRWVEAANAVDSRKGTSDLGQLLDQASKVNLSDDIIRQDSLYYVLGLGSDEPLREKQQEYQSIKEQTLKLLETGILSDRGFITFDTRGYELDRTLLMMEAQKRAPFVSVVGEIEGKTVTTISTSTKVNLVEVFGLPGGAPFRVTLEGNRQDHVIDTLNNLKIGDTPLAGASEQKFNISSKNPDERAQKLNNLYPCSIDVDGVRLPSAETGIQMRKLPPGNLEWGKLSRLSGEEAKKFGERVKYSCDFEGRQVVWDFKGNQVVRGSSQDIDFVEKILRAKIEQNPEVKVALEATKGMTLTHDLGHSENPCTSLHAKDFTASLTKIRGSI